MLSAEKVEYNNRVDDRGRKYVFGPTQAHLEGPKRVNMFLARLRLIEKGQKHIYAQEHQTLLQWNPALRTPALRTPGYCGQFRLSRRGKALTFSLKLTSLIRTPVNTDTLACPLGVRINRVQLYYRRFHLSVDT